jgi:hypothetical protein
VLAIGFHGVHIIASSNSVALRISSSWKGKPFVANIQKLLTNSLAPETEGS